MQQEAFTISPYEKEATRATVCISYQLLTAIEQKKKILQTTANFNIIFCCLSCMAYVFNSRVRNWKQIFNSFGVSMKFREVSKYIVLNIDDFDD